MIFRLPYQNEQAIRYIEENEDKLVCSISKPKNYRSLQQNKYYWFILGLLESNSGIDSNDWHLYFGEKFRRNTKDFNGEIITFTKSSTDLTTMEFEDYMSKIRTFASRELGILLPLPNETEFNYKTY